jgi:hypothetical protein
MAIVRSVAREDDGSSQRTVGGVSEASSVGGWKTRKNGAEEWAVTPEDRRVHLLPVWWFFVGMMRIPS